jgi:hypothetical protein
MSTSKYYSSLWSTLTTPDKKRVFYIPYIYIHVPFPNSFIIYHFVPSPLREIQNCVLLPSRVQAVVKLSTWKKNIFDHGLLLYINCFHHRLRSVIYPCFDFGLSFNSEGCTPAQCSLLPYPINTYWLSIRTPCCPLGDPCCWMGWVLQTGMG